VRHLKMRVPPGDGGVAEERTGQHLLGDVAQAGAHRDLVRLSEILRFDPASARQDGMVASQPRRRPVPALHAR
jgi:hypothetical protein